MICWRQIWDIWVITQSRKSCSNELRALRRVKCRAARWCVRKCRWFRCYHLEPLRARIPRADHRERLTEMGRQCDAASGELQHSVRVYGGWSSRRSSCWYGPEPPLESVWTVCCSSCSGKNLTHWLVSEISRGEDIRIELHPVVHTNTAYGGSSGIWQVYVRYRGYWYVLILL